MPNPVKLDILRELRESANLNQKEAAKLCGLTSKQGRLSLAAWEQGESIPRATRRAKFMSYLWDGLGLRTDSARFERVWETLVHEWHWDPIGDREWARFTRLERPSQDAIRPFQAPAGIPHFVGRQAELDAAREQLADPNGPSILAFVGMGGIGKTTLAVHAAHALRDHFADGILWANAANTNPLDIAQSWAQVYGYDFSGLSDLESRAAALRNVLAEKHALIIFDDLVDAAVVRPLLPGGEKCRVLISTRNHDIASTLNAQPISPPELPTEAGVDLLVRVLGAPRVDAEVESARRICEIVEGLPLAVEIVAQRLFSRPQQSLGNMVARLEDSSQRLGLEISDRAIRAAFEVSWNLLSDDQREVFSLMGVFEGRSFAIAALAYIGERAEAEMEDLVWGLQALSLVGADGGGRYRQHPLIADFAGERVTPDKSLHYRYICFYLRFVERHKNDTDSLETEWENSFAAVKIANRQKEWEVVLQFVHALHEPWTRNGRIREALWVYEIATEAAGNLAVDAQKMQIFLLSGRAYIELGEYEQANSLLNESLDRAYQFEDESTIADIHYSLAHIATEQGQYKLATESLDICESIRMQSKNDIAIAEVYLGQAWLYFDYGPDFDRAEQLGLKALSFAHSADETELYGQILHLLAQVTAEQLKFDEAYGYADQARKLFDLSQNCVELAAVYHALVIINRSRKKYEQAQHDAEIGLATFRRLGIRRGEGMILRQMSLIAKELEQVETALLLAQKSYHIFRTLSDPLGTAYALRNIGDLFMLQEKYVKAVDVWQEVKAIAEQLQHGTLSVSIDERFSRIEFSTLSSASMPHSWTTSCPTARV